MPSCASGPSPIRNGSRAGSRCSATRIPSRSPRSRSTSSARLLERNLAERSYAGILETAADGLADVAYLEGPRGRASSFRPTSPSHRSRVGCRRRSTCPRRRSPTRRSRSSRTPPALAAPVRAARARAARSPSTSRPTAARSAPLPTGRPPTAPCASCRSRRGSAARSCAASSTATRSPRARSLRLLADGREIIAHNARYEQSWLTFHFGLPAWRIGLRHELRVPRLRAPLVDPGSGLRAPRRDARDRHAPPAGRAQGRLRRRLVGRRAARAGRSSTTPPTTRSRCSSCAIARCVAGRGSSAAPRRCWRPRAPPASRRSAVCRSPTATPVTAAYELIDGAADEAALATRRRGHPAAPAVGAASARCCASATPCGVSPGRPRRPEHRYEGGRRRTSVRASTAQAARQSSSEALSAGLCEMPVGLRTNSIAAGR